jgi:putative hydrolase of the HAD superfamily
MRFPFYGKRIFFKIDFVIYKYVFIDLDDTIWDFHSNARLALADMFVANKLSKYFPNFDAFFDIYAKRNIELWESYAKKEITKEFLMVERFSYSLLQMGVDNLELATAIGDEYLDRLPLQKALMPHAIEILEYLQSKYKLTIISNGFVEVQYRKIKSSNIGQYFSHIVLSEAANALKPDRKIFDYAMELNGAAASECIMIGDSYAADIVGAQNAGIDQVYFNTKELEINQKATYFIQDLNELKAIL